MDANLLVLLVAGTLDPEVIGRHRRLQGFDSTDFEALRRAVADHERVLVTPNTLTEASNLLGQHAEPERSSLLEGLGVLIRDSHEVVVASAEAADHESFRLLGLSDAGLLGLMSRNTPIVTADLALYLAALTIDPWAAINYRHLRDIISSD